MQKGMLKHTTEERLNGVNKTCTLSVEKIRNCNGYQMIGDRACDNRHVPGFRSGDKVIICKFNKFNVNAK